MKKLIFPLVALLCFSFAKETSKLSDEDRKMILGHLTQTRDQMVKIVDSLTDEQLNFKPSENSWSIAECVEHLALTEKTFVEIAHKSVADGPKPELKDSLVFKDEQIMPAVMDRSSKVKTSEPFEPSGQFDSADASLKDFLDTRNKLIEYVKTTDDDLRNRFNSDLPFGTVDVAQLIIFTAGHTGRHVLQMEENMAHVDFPSK